MVYHKTKIVASEMWLIAMFYEKISSAYVGLLQIVDTWTMHLDAYPNNKTN